MKILILGASGLVGGNCMRYFASQGWTCLGTHFSFETADTVFYNTLDPSDPNNADIDAFQPDVIIHCGALTWVDYCEEHEDKSYQKTVVSTQNATKLAERYKAKLVYLSTDYVFDGTRGFYTEEDDTFPLSVYGKHKLKAEDHVRENLTNFLICRITNVYGDEIRGKNFIARLIENMRKKEPMELRLPLDQYATPINAFDIARAIYLLLSEDKKGLYHFAGTDYLNRVQLAQRVITYFGHEQVSLIPVTTQQLRSPARRPLLGGMSAQLFNEEFPHFRWSNVDDYLQKLKDKK